MTNTVFRHGHSFRVGLLEVMISGMTSHSIEPRSMNELRAQVLRHDGEEPTRAGPSLALDAPYPDGHPLAGATEPVNVVAYQTKAGAE